MIRSFMRELSMLKASVKGVTSCITRTYSVRGLDVPDDPSTISAGTMSEVKSKMMDRLGLSVAYTPVPPSREKLLQYHPKKENLPPRSMRDSLTSAIIPLSTDRQLQDRYINSQGNVRQGRLLEDADLFAVWACHKYVHLPELPEGVHLPYTFVTILVDEVEYSDYLTKGSQNIRLDGHVCWVGTSSMEVVVFLSQEDRGQWHNITSAVFLMAARNATNTGSAPVNPLQPADELEKEILAGAVERKKRRQLSRATSIQKVEPTEYEQSLIYNIFKRTTHTNTMELNKRSLPGNCSWMTDSYTVSTSAAFPENRNAHNSVFGGFLMRMAVESSWITAFLFCKQRPRLTHISDISFEKPISVNSFIKISAYVIYSEANYIQTMVISDVLCGYTSNQMTSNIFFLTYRSPDLVPEVLPRTYHESMWYIQGRRKFKHALNLD